VWNGHELGEWMHVIDGADMVINLAGRSVDCRYSEANRREIMNSRVESTRAVGRAIAAAARPPALWINASTATIYRHSLDRAMDETTGELGGDEAGAQPTWKFSTEVAKAWEAAFFEAKTPQTRKVATRSAIVMISGASWLGKLTNLMRWGLGGTEGSGRQFMSWIHAADFIRAVEFLIARKDVEGAVNVCSPNPLPNREFLRLLRSAFGVRFAPPLPEWTLRLGSMLMRTEAELVLKSRRVVPGRLLDAGFEFAYPEWAAAVCELASRGRTAAKNQGQYEAEQETHGNS
jgi:uncharacterized protein (TIGR01777 family)